MVFQRAGEYADRDKAVSFLVIAAAIAVVVCLIMVYLIIPVNYILNEGFSRKVMANVLGFLGHALNPAYLTSQYSQWIKKCFMSRQLGTMLIPFIPFITAIAIFVIAVIINPNDFMLKTFGGGRMATYADVKKMKLFNGFIMVLGRFKGKLLKMPETLSALVVAPPGTGKTDQYHRQ